MAEMKTSMFSTISEGLSKLEFKFFDSSAGIGLQFERLLKLSSNRTITSDGSISGRKQVEKICNTVFNSIP